MDEVTNIMISNNTDEYYKRQLDNAVANIVNILYMVRNTTVDSKEVWDKKLNAILILEKSLPDIKRVIMYFRNLQKGN